VFTDAAKYVLDGSSPYERATYRYTPLLAYMMLPNLTWFRAFGKVLFVLCDLIAGFLIHRLMHPR
jgi:phosphatidylinositol glycan class M